jgi:hypothetical protein
MYACWKPAAAAAAAAVTGLASERERVGRRTDWTPTESETEREADGREEEGTGKGETMGERESGGPRGWRMEEREGDRGCARGGACIYGRYIARLAEGTS